MTDTPIHIEALAKTYRRGHRRDTDVEAIRDLTLDVHRGEVFGLLGPNGAGKTTLVKLLLGITIPTSGFATINGVPIGRSASRQDIGYLPENHRFPDYLTGDGVMNYLGSLSGLDRTRRKARTNELLETVDMVRWRTKRIRTYSKGMLQRIGLAQALLNDPSVVFLDEPTDGVDPIGRMEIRDVIHRMRTHGTTVFLNSHLLSEVELICDRVAIMNRGRILRVGNVHELTRASNRTVVEIEGDIPLNLVSTLGLSATAAHNMVEIEGSAEDVNRILDAIRAEGLLIRSVMPVHRSLEEYFVELIGQEAHKE